GGGRGGGGPGGVGGVGGLAVTVLCRAETDADGAADASLRALSFATGLAGPAPLEAVVFGLADQVPRDSLAAHGAARAYLIEPGHIGGYAPPGRARARARPARA